MTRSQYSGEVFFGNIVPINGMIFRSVDVFDSGFSEVFGVRSDEFMIVALFFYYYQCFEELRMNCIV